MNDPKMREAVDLVDKVYLEEFGQPTAVKMICRKQLVHDHNANAEANAQERAIRYQKEKQAGKWDISQAEATARSKIQSLNSGNLPDPTVLKRLEKKSASIYTGR